MTYKTRTTSSAYQRSNAYDLLRRIEQTLPSHYERSATRAFYTPAPHRRRRGRELLLGASPGWIRISPDYALGGFWKESGAIVEFIPHETAAGETIAEAFGLLGLPVPRRP